MVEQGPEKPQSGAFRQLHGLDGAFVNETSSQDAVLTVSEEKNKWNQNIEKTADLFWPLIKEAYSRSDDEMDRQLQISFENVDQIFIKTDGEKVLGFLCVERDKSDPTVAIIRDVIVRKEFQNTGIGKELYTSLFSDTTVDAVISATTTLAAQVNRFAVGKDKGFESYYGTMGTGNPEVERLRVLDTNYLEATKVLAAGQSLFLNDKYTGLVLTVEDYIPRLNREEVSRMPEGPLKEQGEKILTVQAKIDEKLGNDAPVVAGHLISIREPEQKKA